MELSLLATFAAGLLTFASPCVLPLPVYLGLLAGSGGRPVLAATGFAAGLSAVFVALGLAASAAASVLAEHRALLLAAGGAVLVLFGLKLLGLLRIPFLDREARPLLRRAPRAAGPIGGLVLGAAFGLGWTPCVGPVLGAVLTYAAGASAGPGEAAAYLLSYAAGLSLPLVAGSFAAPFANRLLARMRRFTPAFQRGTGALLVAAGVLLAMDRLDLAAVPGGEAAVCEGGCEADVAAGVDASPLAGEPRLVVFTSPTCAACERMRPVIAETERACDAAPGTVRPIDLADEGGRALARRYAVRVVPTFLSLDANGEEVSRLVGEQRVASLARALEDVRADRCTM
jgi:cytochrome c-type biogenesis protein